MTSIFGHSLLEKAKGDSSIVAITAAMEKGTGLVPFKEVFPQRFLDVGIAEPMAVTMAASMSLTGLKPVVAIYSTFMQRAVDQVIHDIAINSLPVVFVLDRAGLVPQDGETHQGLFDLTIFRSVPHSQMLAPITKADMDHSLDFALHANGPVFIRIAKDIALKDSGDEEEFIAGRD
jgi:1-deoxy-D-xylulose-5-phosphate synthase